MTTRRQHYVWRKYLEPWAMNDKVWCFNRRGNKTFQANPVNLGVERDFYKLTYLEVNDLKFVFDLAIRPIKNDRLRELNQGWIDLFKALFVTTGFIRNHKSVSAEILKEVENYLITLEEGNYAKLESSANKYLDSLVSGNISFLSTDDNAIEFSYFLAHQYFRTKRIKEKTAAQFSETQHKARLERIWPVLRNIFATNVGFSIFSRRNQDRFILLESPKEKNFLTADQPVINTRADLSRDEEAQEVEFYYPVSPRYAVLVASELNGDVMNRKKKIEAPEVDRLNAMIVDWSFEQVYSASAETLEEHCGGEA